MSTQLYIRSVFSLLSSMCSIKGAVLRAKELGYSSLAIVDRNILSGAITFKKECEKQGIKPIYGMEFDVESKDRVFTCLLYAKNDDGYQNLMKLSSFLNTSKETLTIDKLKDYKANNILVLLSDAMPLTYYVDKKLDIEECMKLQESMFGNDYFIGLVDNNIAINAKRNNEIKKIANKYNIKTLALSRTFYINRDDYREYEVLKCIGNKKTLDDNSFFDEGRHLLGINEMSKMYDGEDIKNNDFLASLCNVKFDFSTSLPKYKTPNDIPSKDYLIALCNEGLKRRLKGSVTKEYQSRLDYELKVIIEMKFEDYFLIVYDFILYAKKNGIMVGPGRGSAAGSLVSYCLGITDIDPIKYGLLFERFLNPERISMPDIDTDFPDDRREEMFEYVKEKYGVDHVAHIVTYGTLKAKQVIRDVGKVLNYSNNDIDALSKLIPFSYNFTLMDAYNNSALFKQKIESEQKYRDLFKIALKLEGFPRQKSIHAAGIIMSDRPLIDVVPVFDSGANIYSTQYTMEHLEEFGLIKMDFLSLRNLDIINEIVEDIKDNVDKNFNIKDIPLNDAKTFKLIDDVNLQGVFQLESSGMQNLARKMKPKSFEELGMMIALFRPGPMDNIPEFLKNRENPSRITYLVPSLKPILEETYGIIVYQEQIMTIARVLAGFSYGKADLLRRAMSKKKASELEKLQNDFIEGCVKNGYQRSVANELYELVLKFANYGFNKSHSIAYGMIAYELAYLKANYPLYFYKALLNGVIGAEAKTYEYIKECKNIGIKIQAISMNESDIIYTIKDNKILMPFSACKDVGGVSCNKIIEERNEKGKFKDYIDCVYRLTLKGVERNVIENLIYAGAFDEFNLSRFSMNKALENTLKYVNTHKNGISIIEGFDDAPIIENLKDDKMVSVEYEKNVLGFYFSFNPIEEIKNKNNINVPSINEILNVTGYVKGFGLIKRVKTHRTKKGDMMCFVDLSDDSGDISLVVMPNIYSLFETKIAKNKYVYFEGNIEKEASVLVKKLNVL